MPGITGKLELFDPNGNQKPGESVSIGDYILINHFPARES